MAEATHSAKRYRSVFWWLLGACFLLRLGLMAVLPLSGDEAYHWEWSRHPAFGYYDHPGLTAFLIRGATLLTGRSTEFTVRLPALLLLSGTAVVCFLFARSVARARGAAAAAAERAGAMAGVLALVTPIFVFFSVYMSTDPPLIFCWTLTLYLAWRAFDGGAWGAWIGAGAALGCALLSKFLSFLIAPALLAFLLVSKPDRAWLRRPQPYVAAACALVVWLPFLWWNATHGWATFMFNFVYRQGARTFAPRFALEYVGGQALAVSPGVFVLALLALGGGLLRRRARDRAALLLGCGTLIPLAYYLWVGLGRRVGLHWPAAAWTGAFVSLACAGTAGGAARPRCDRWRRWSLALCVILAVALHAAPLLPYRWVKSIGTWSYPGSPQRISTAKYVELFGWPLLGQKVQAEHDRLLREQSARGGAARGVFLLGGEYGLTALTAFYTPEQLPAHLWAKRSAHGENYRFWDDFGALRGMDAVYVAKREAKAREALLTLREHFRAVEEPERVPVTVDGEEVRAFFLVRCREFDGRAPDFAPGP